MRIAVRGTPVAPASETAAPACAVNRDLYAHELLERPPVRSKVTKAVWLQYRAALDEVRASCASCPLFVECIYRAVVQVDVAGYVGCTTPRERRQIRRMLGVTVAPENFDDVAGVRVEGSPVDHDTVLAARRAHPGDRFDQLADRLGCSVSTIKRHLRRARQPGGDREAGEGTGESERESARPERTHVNVPSVDDVLDCFDAVVESDR